jgi:hypothetical protein
LKGCRARKPRFGNTAIQTGTLERSRKLHYSPNHS